MFGQPGVGKGKGADDAESGLIVWAGLEWCVVVWCGVVRCGQRMKVWSGGVGGEGDGVDEGIDRYQEPEMREFEGRGTRDEG